MAKTIVIYEKRDVVKFKRRGKVLTGAIVGRWAPGEGDGYAVMTEDGEHCDVRAASIVALVKV